MTGLARWRALAAGPLVAALMLLAAFVLCHRAGVSVVDPDNVAAQYFGLVVLGMAVMVGVDCAWRAGRREGRLRPSLEGWKAVRRERWTPGRCVAVVVALGSFYLSYLAYRNMKAIVPLLRPDALFDRDLEAWDGALLGGHQVAEVLHTALGTGIVTQLLSTTYAAFIVFLPLSLAVGLVFAPKLQMTLFFACALSLNWALGNVTYFALPSLGPVYADPGLFAGLPHSLVTDLQRDLLDQRIAYLRDPAGSLPQSIAAFGSLHIAMSSTAALAAQLLGVDRRLRIGLWIWTGVTVVATLYLGWHYLVDDIAGVVMACISLAVARVLTGFDVGAERRRARLGAAATASG